MTTIEDFETADWMHHRLEDAYNKAIHCLQQARYFSIQQLNYGDGSSFTEFAEAAIDQIGIHEANLIDWQARQEAEHG